MAAWIVFALLSVPAGFGIGWFLHWLVNDVLRSR